MVIPLVVLTLSVAGRAWAETYALQKIALVGDPAPGGGAFAAFEPIEAMGDFLLFEGSVEGDAGTVRALFLAGPGGLRRVVGQGDRLPDGGQLLEFSSPEVNSAGAITFRAAIRGGGAPMAIFLAEGSTLRRVVAVREGSPTGGVLREMSDVSLSDGGEVAFIARIEGGQTPQAILLASEGTLRPLLMAGEATPVGGTFHELQDISMNRDGAVAFEARVYGGRSPSGIFAAVGDQTRVVAAVGDPTPVGGTFKDVALPTMNDHQEVIFWGSVEGSDHPSGLFRWQNGRLTKVVARGDAAPGGGSFSFITLSYRLNGDGTMSFRADLTDSKGNAGIFLASREGLRRVVGVGDPVPSGGTVHDLDFPVGREAGRVIFQAGLGDGPSTSGLFQAVPKGQR
ncbi:MAG: choice-of-anchor tandem repeat NxxGxxAF-containing protein [Candidatus Methylomirabilales bacterium]